MAENYTIEELLLDESFIEFCLHPESPGSLKWEQLIATNSINTETLEEARTILNMLGPGLSQSEIAEEITRLRSLIDESSLQYQFRDNVYPPVPEKMAAPKKRVFKMAPVFSVLITVIAIAVYFSISTKQSTASVAIAIFKTKTGEQKKIVLPDGTSVILNSNTSLTYDKGFNEKDRIVHLSGKAFFKVAKNADKPFSVYSSHYSTTALGTAFYVSGDSSENYSVELLEGKVKLNSFNTKQIAVLNAGEEGLWKTGNKQFSRQTYDSAYLNRWLSGQIVFRKTPAAEAFDALRKWYGVDIIDNRKDRSNTVINGTYENVLLEDILKVICFSLNCQMRYDKEKIIIQ